MTWKESTGEEWKDDSYQGDYKSEPFNDDEDFDLLREQLLKGLNEILRSFSTPSASAAHNTPAPKDSYILDGEIIRAPKNYAEYLEGFKIENRRINHTILKDGTFVSTVFLSLDHSFGTGTPILFETLGVHNGEEFCMKRYPTYEAALTGHRETVEELQEIIKKGAN